MELSTLRNYSVKYLELLTLIQAGKFQDAQRILTSEPDWGNAFEKRSLESLLSFQVGKLEPVKHVSFFEKVLWLALVRVAPLRFFLGHSLRLFAAITNTIGLRQRLFVHLYEKFWPSLIHCRYSDFLRGLNQCFLLEGLAPRGEVFVEVESVRGLLGHFYCLSGRFDLGLKFLELSRERLQLLTSTKVGDDENPIGFVARAEVESILALHLSYAGRFEEARQLYETLLAEFSIRPYFWLELFCRSMRSYLAMESLSPELLQEDSKALKALLGGSFISKYGLRTTAFSALMAAVRGDLKTAREQTLTSDSFYEKTVIRVEQGRYHYVRALTALELGDLKGASYHSQRAVSFVAPLPGGMFHECDSILLDVEIRLRSALIDAQESKKRMSFDGIKSKLDYCSRRIKGAPSFRARIAALRALLNYLQGKFNASELGLAPIRAELALVAPRMAHVVRKFDSGGAHPEMIISMRHARSDMSEESSLIEKIVSVARSQDLDKSSCELLRYLFSAERCSCAKREILQVSSGGRNRQYSLEQVGESLIEIKVELPRKQLVYSIENPLNHAQFDNWLGSALDLGLSIIHAAYLNNLNIEEERLVAMGRIAAQVSHDIRSPLSALDMVLRDLSQVPEEKRVLVRASLGRIRDIANNLLQSKSRGTLLNGEPVQSGNTNEISLQLVSALIDELITEKRMLFRSKINVQIDFNLTEGCYGVFAALNVVEFKRVLSNLINHAVEAMGDMGRVTVDLKREGKGAVLSVVDTGPGIPPVILSKLGQRGETHGKQGGSGLGLYHARTSIESWGGRFEISSMVGTGTTIKLHLPTCQPPKWFVEKITLEPELQIVVLDDDTSIHQIWKERFESFIAEPFGLKLIHLATPQQVRDFVAASFGINVATLFLMDYELLGFKETGLDLVAELGIKNHCVLVTSRFEEPSIRARCEEMGVPLIPKGMAGFIPIEASLKKAVDQGISAVLIDDDSLVHATWRMAAREAAKRIAMFSEAEDFFARAADFNVEVPVYVDVSLARGVRGEEIAKRIFNLGFSNIYLATGYAADQVQPLPFLKGIVGKEPPFIN